MAFKLEDLVRGQAGNANYPYGFCIDGDEFTGTKDSSDRVNDWGAFFQKLLIAAGITPSGIPDTVLISDYWNALLQVIIDEMGVKSDSNPLNHDKAKLGDYLLVGGPSVNVVYQAPFDMFFNVVNVPSTGYLTAKVNTTSPPTTIRAGNDSVSGNIEGIHFEAKKDEYVLIQNVGGPGTGVTISARPLS